MDALIDYGLGHLAFGIFHKSNLRIHHFQKILGFGPAKNLELRLAGQLREELASLARHRQHDAATAVVLAGQAIGSGVI